MIVDVVIPAAGIGSRMKSKIPKQYLKIANKTILEHTISIFLNSPLISKIIVVIKKDDVTFRSLPIASSPKIITTEGGDERVNSVLSGVNEAKTDWVLVHDAARPCLAQSDLNLLVANGTKNCGAILATPVRDTMKRADDNQNIIKTEERRNLYHALTPQLFQRDLLIKAISEGLKNKQSITDEASAIELLGYKPQIIVGRSDNIKVTSPDDLAMAEFILSHLGN